MNQLGLVLLLWLLPGRLEFLPGASIEWISRGGGRAETNLLQGMTDDLRGRLQVNERVLIEIVDHNPLVMSVETLAGRAGPFVISVDRDFVRELNHQEIEAAIAHELGHVWIYTHSPYVQTERLANDVAMRAVNRSAFEPVYEKVWSRTGVRGNLIEFLGPPPQ